MLGVLKVMHEVGEGAKRVNYITNNELRLFDTS